MKANCVFSGVKAVDKREGGGAFNWGSMDDDIKAQQDTANTTTDGAPAEGATDKDGEESGNNRRDERADEEPREEEPKTLTLAEWKAQQEKRNEPKFNFRKAGEGQDVDPKWKKAFAYKKEKETVEDEDDEVISSCQILLGTQNQK